jgi:hypothetical protein
VLEHFFLTYQLLIRDYCNRTTDNILNQAQVNFTGIKIYAAYLHFYLIGQLVTLSGTPAAQLAWASSNWK